MSKLLLLDDLAIKQMLKNEAIVDAFPFLRGAAAKASKKASSCKPCAARSKNRANTADYAGIKAAIAGLSADRKRTLKQMLNAEEVRVYYTNIKRQKVKLTF
jgi:hypothetical protein